MVKQLYFLGKMRFSITSNDHHLYETNHFVEFEEMVTPEEVNELRTHAKEALCKRIDCTDETLSTTHPYESFMRGRDLWQDDGVIKQVAFRKRHAEIASLLTRKRPIRFGYDQLLQTPDSAEKLTTLEKLPTLFHTETLLTEMSCFQGVVCGFVLNVSTQEAPIDQQTYSIEEGTTTLCPIPKKPGSGIFFSPTIPLSLEYLFELPSQTHLLIVYCEEKAVYIRAENDPHTHALRNAGYEFGDRVQNTTHPILFR